MGAAWGLLAALLIGCADCATRVTSRRMSITLLVAATTLLSLGGILAALGAPSLDDPTRYRAYFLGLVAGALHIITLYLLFVALARGPVSIAVAGASSNIVFVLLLNAAAGEPWSVAQFGSAAAVLFGIVMAARPERSAQGAATRAHLRRTAALGLGAGVVGGFRVFLMQEAADDIGFVDALVSVRVGAAAVITPVALVLVFRVGRSLRWPSPKLAPLVLLQAVFETLALLAFLHGSVSASRIGAALGYAATPLASTVAARVVLGDPIGVRRGWWIVFVALALGAAVLGAP